MLEIRRYCDADQDAVWDLHNVALHQVGAHAGNGPWDADLHQIESVYLSNHGEFLVGLVGGCIVAMGAIKRQTQDIAELKRMRVHPDCQKLGYGTVLLQVLLDRAVALGYSRLRLDTTVQQVAARRLYEKAGFVPTGNGILAGFSVLFFEKDLRSNKQTVDANGEDGSYEDQRCPHSRPVECEVRDSHLRSER